MMHISLIIKWAIFYTAISTGPYVLHKLQPPMLKTEIKYVVTYSRDQAACVETQGEILTMLKQQKRDKNGEKKRMKASVKKGSVLKHHLSMLPRDAA